MASFIILILENNHFKFVDGFYLQKMGTAVGTSVGPLMCVFVYEENWKTISSVLKPTLLLRFLDDIFMIWDHSLNELHSFIDNNNNFHPCINFTNTISQKSGYIFGCKGM